MSIWKAWTKTLDFCKFLAAPETLQQPPSGAEPGGPPPKRMLFHRLAAYEPLPTDPATELTSKPRPRIIQQLFSRERLEEDAPVTAPVGRGRDFLPLLVDHEPLPHDEPIPEPRKERDFFVWLCSSESLDRETGTQENGPSKE